MNFGRGGGGGHQLLDIPTVGRTTKTPNQRLNNTTRTCSRTIATIAGSCELVQPVVPSTGECTLGCALGDCFAQEGYELIQAAGRDRHQGSRERQPTESKRSGFGRFATRKGEVNE